MLVAIAATVLAFQTPTINTLSQSEKKAGFKLLFDGKTTKGWHNFKSKDIGSGWEVKDGILKSVNPEKAGDIVTEEKFSWFELKLDFRMDPGMNSGIMFHVSDTGEATWQSGPEVQLFDNRSNPEVQKAGWLYQLYESKTDATKPAGEWNSLRILVAPKKCETYMNGVKYYEYVLGSDDFKARVAKSKFAEFPEFAKLGKGSIAIQGDHGVVSFRNIKIRPIK